MMTRTLLLAVLLALLACGCAGGGRDPVVLGVRPEAAGTGAYCLRDKERDRRWDATNCGICHWIL